MGKYLLMLAALSGFAAVAMGAFGAHIMRHRLEPYLFSVYQTAVMYHMFHALALMSLAACGNAIPSKALAIVGLAFIVGTVFFSGSLYGISMLGLRWLGPITPLGGVSWLFGWLTLAWYSLRG